MKEESNIFPKPFSSIEEIINYLKYEYKEAYLYIPEPKIIDGEEVLSMGHLNYDLRVFYIVEFLEENNYIFEKYYSKKDYPEFFKEDYYSYDIDNLDIDRVSYMLYRIFNLERICEGLVDKMVKNGSILKLVERAVLLKK